MWWWERSYMDQESGRGWSDPSVMIGGLPPSPDLPAPVVLGFFRAGQALLLCVLSHLSSTVGAVCNVWLRIA